MSELQPRSDLAYVGCPKCGWVTTVVLEPSEQPPWCTHAQGIAWRGPASPESNWTRMVRVSVFT